LDCEERTRVMIRYHPYCILEKKKKLSYINFPCIFDSTVFIKKLSYIHLRLLLL
jgi:hypothetical protein